MSTLFCRICKTDLSFETFSPFQQTAPYPRCKPCVNRKSKDWYGRNPEKRIQTARKWALANPEKVAAKIAKWRAANPDRTRATSKRYSDTLKVRVFDHYGRICACCGENVFRFLCIDHINNDGNTHRETMSLAAGTQFYAWLERNNFPDGFQTLCYNCNQGKHQNKGICPHKEQMKHPDQDQEDEVHEIKHPHGHGLMDTRRDLHNRSPHSANTPVVGSQSTPPMDPTQSY